MVLEGDPLEPRFKMTVGTAQAGDPSHAAAPKAPPHLLCGVRDNPALISYRSYLGLLHQNR